MSAVIRNASFYLNGKKMGKANSGTVNFDTGNEIMIGDGKVIGASQGVLQVTLDVNSIEPVSGAQDGLIDALVNKKDIDVTVALLDGRILECPMKPFTASYDTDMARGTLNRKTQFHSVDEPTFTG